ncbi:L-serine ammonia-lyase [Campylobacter suis]|uniref:L-serine dehydratase n=1 Tax=Campylobacter suis TaxID=2790657 RepID=A0ABM8Q2G3_9BACT|nr:L-serine ammonia-lyase [Campylobacter suis]CAD7287047.1 L-serine dehydratase TdcG [Campylobacter suis]
MSNLEIFKIGIGPSSSHTLGPLVAANKFCENLDPYLDKLSHIKVQLFGSLSLTGRGHLSDKAVIWGLCGLSASELNANLQEEIISLALKQNIIKICGKKQISFNYDNDIIFEDKFLKLHENGLVFSAFDNQSEILKQTFYSVGGGFVMSEVELKSYLFRKEEVTKNDLALMQVNNAADAVKICEQNGWDLAELSLNYELQFHSLDTIKSYCSKIWETMQGVYASGINPKDPNLPGVLNLHRRAKGLYARLYANDEPMAIIDYISLYAIAIAEENASGAKVVTAPTNGACAVIPAVMLYLKNHTQIFSEEKAVKFLLTAMMIGSFYKKNASISGAEAGCQAEVGSASSMAAGAMATIYGANASVACGAAEIAMEHHLGLTCDPVGGLVQIPCIERNAFGAIKAIAAARMAIIRKSTPRVGLDEVIKTMYETGKDMNSKYKETALGGLAINVGSVC